MRVERILWGSVMAPLAAAAAIDPGPRTLGALVGFVAAKWVCGTLILGAHAALHGGTGDHSQTDP